MFFLNQINFTNIQIHGNEILKTKTIDESIFLSTFYKSTHLKITCFLLM
jgi:hypothetical protein